MKLHRESLRKQQTAAAKKQEELSNVEQPDAFKMKKFTQVQSRVKQELHNLAQMDELRPQHDSGKKGFGARPGSGRP